MENGVTARTSKALEDNIYIICMNDVIVKSLLLNLSSLTVLSIPVLRRVSSPTDSSCWTSKLYIKMFLCTTSTITGSQFQTLNLKLIFSIITRLDEFCEVSRSVRGEIIVSIQVHG